MSFLFRPWQRLVNRSEVARTRWSMERRLSSIERTLDQSYCDSILYAGHAVHLIAGLGSSDESIRQLRTQVLAAAVEAPERWIFLIQEGPWGSESQGSDQYSVARHVARRLQIPLVEQPFLLMTSETVIAAANQRGLPVGATEDDLYSALCYDSLPRPDQGGTREKGLRSGEIHGAVHPRWEAVRIQREMHWTMELPRLVGIVAHLLDRITHERPGTLDEYYDQQLRQVLCDAALDLNGQRLRAALLPHPAREEVLLLLDEVYLPVLLPALARPPA
jgi:hypothetical protein